MTDTGKTEKHAGGRPTAYNAEMAATAKGAYAMGATDQQVADLLGVVINTIYNWKVDHPEFLQITKSWKDHADERVERSLYERATGYSHPDVDIKAYEGSIITTEIVKHYPPDTASMIFWLKNRKRADWKDRVDHNVSGNLSNMSDEEIDRRAAELLAKGRGQTDE